MYAAEQSDDVEGEGRAMDEDVIPWFHRHWNTDLTLREFPYLQYDGPDDSAEVRQWMDTHGADDIWALPDHLRESEPYRTDVVAVRVDPRAVHRRERAVGSLTPLIRREGWKQDHPRLRAWCNFRRDGPMTADYYVNTHGVGEEPNGQPRGQSKTTVKWLGDHGFLRENPGGEGLEPVDIGFLFAAAHAIELKRETSEWDTALEQASRADVFADFRWVAMSERTAHRAVENLETFRGRGVGLISVSSSTGDVTTHVEPERCTPPEDHDQLSRPYCERWTLNERILKRLDDE